MADENIKYVRFKTVKTRAELPETLEVDKIYFLEDEGIIIVDRGSGSVEYGSATKLQEKIAEVVSENKSLEEKISTLKEISSWKIVESLDSVKTEDLKEGQYVLIVKADTADADNGKLYSWNGEKFEFIVDLAYKDGTNGLSAFEMAKKYNDENGFVWPDENAIGNTNSTETVWLNSLSAYGEYIRDLALNGDLTTVMSKSEWTARTLHPMAVATIYTDEDDDTIDTPDYGSSGNTPVEDLDEVDDDF